MHDDVSQTPLNEKCLFSESSKRDVDRNRHYNYDLEAYALEVKEVHCPEYDVNSEQSAEFEKCSESFFTETATFSRGQIRGNEIPY